MKTYLFLLATLWSAVQFGAAGQTALTLSAEEDPDWAEYDEMNEAKIV